MSTTKAKRRIVEFDYDVSKYDSSNPLVLPSRKKQNRASNKRKREDVIQATVLSKKQRKALERKVSQKKKKLTRSELWQELESLQNIECRPAVSIIPIFNGKDKSSKGVDKYVSKGKSWGQPERSSSSTSTDDYSSSDTDFFDNESFVSPKQPCNNGLDASEQNSEAEPAQDLVSEEHDELKSHDNLEHNTSICSNENTQKSSLNSRENCPARFVLVSRAAEVSSSRLTLPILAEEASIMECVSENDCVIICGATGCGKTTQVPQFLYEAGYSLDGYMIGITEPRRVAAVSMSARVGEELNLNSNQVSYHIRYDKTADKQTQIKFMTDGVLLQEIKQDFELSRYSAIIVDEAHERSIYTDILLGLISMVVRLRRCRYNDGIPTRDRILCPLKLIIMSATLRVTDFLSNKRLFPDTSKPPVIDLESRQFPVTCHFAKVTHEDYLKAAFRKVVSIHRESPPGGILVFVTGQQEALVLCNWLNRAFPKWKTENTQMVPNESACKPVKVTDCSKATSPIIAEDKSNQPETHIDLDNFDIIPKDEESELRSIHQHSVYEIHPKSDDENDYFGFDDHDGDDEEMLEQINQTRSQFTASPVSALPLYSLLAPELQELVFTAPPDGHRKIVVATNVAETSLTIPDIRFVVDTGKVKTKVYDPATGASSFEIVWISQASAEQRAGRAGRVAPGHCYRLYSSQVFSNMTEFTKPDILTRPIDEVVLLLKSYLGTTSLLMFPLPTAPPANAVEAAERRLVTLDALKEIRDGPYGTVRSITEAGRWMTRIPIPPRFARMLLFANQHDLMPYALNLIVALSVPDLFLPQNNQDSSEQELKFRTNFVQQFVRKRDDLYLGDLAILLGTMCCLDRYGAQINGILPPEKCLLEFCSEKQMSHDPQGVLRVLVQRCGVRWNAYREATQLRKQLIITLNVVIPNLNFALNPFLPPPSSAQINQLRQLFLVGSPCHVASKFNISFSGLPASDRRRLRYAYQIPGKSDPVFIASSSPLARENCPFVAYLELYTTSKPILRTVCAIDPQWLPFLAPHTLTVDGMVLSDEASTTTVCTQEENSVCEGESDNEKKQVVSAVRLPSPVYDVEHDLVVSGAKTINYMGSGIVSSEEVAGSAFLELPNSVVLIPINSIPSKKINGENEALTWSVRWFLRFLLEGVIFTEFDYWFPMKIKKSISPRLLTVSWGIIRYEVRNLVSLLVADKVDSKRALIKQWRTDPQYLVNELAEWLKPDSTTEFHTAWPIVPVDVTK